MSAILFSQRKQLNLVPRSWVNCALTCRGLHFWRHFLIKQNSSKFGHQLLVMVNYACAFSQSELGKYFEWIINREYYTVMRRYEFYFRVAKQYFTSEPSKWVKYCFCHEKIKFISSSRRVMFFLLCRQKDVNKMIDFYSRKSILVTAQIYSAAI